MFKRSIELVGFMECGTHSEYIGNVIPFLRSIEEYKFYLRQRNIFGNSKTILYAV